MKRSGLYCLAMILLLASCKDKTASSILHSSNLPSIFITLNSDSAYMLKTSKGAIIMIPKNSFDVPANSNVLLEVKEAYSIKDILLAGLSTTSDGKPLQSGGMIYINATAGGQEAKIIQPIHISIPTKIYNTDMQLYKGDINPDSTINWVAPQPLDSSVKAKALYAGDALFNMYCKSCHKPQEDFTGPALAHCRDREPNKDWVYAFVDHVNTMLQTDRYAKALTRKFGSAMQQQNLTKDEIKNILDYCDNAADVNGSVDSSMEPQWDAIDMPCGFDTVYENNNDYSSDSTEAIYSVNEPDSVMPDSMPSSATASPEGLFRAEDVEGLRNGFTESNTTQGMYDFTVTTLGWYNIDAGVLGYSGTVNIKLSVVLQMPFDDKMGVYLFCPKRKMLSTPDGNDDKRYWFDKNGNKQIPLFPNDKAYILAFGSHNDKIYYGFYSFTVKGDLDVVIQLKETTTDQLKQFIINKEIDGIKIDTLEKKLNIIKIPCGTDSTRPIVDKLRRSINIVATRSEY